MFIKGFRITYNKNSRSKQTYLIAFVVNPNYESTLKTNHILPNPHHNRISVQLHICTRLTHTYTHTHTHTTHIFRRECVGCSCALLNPSIDVVVIVIVVFFSSQQSSTQHNYSTRRPINALIKRFVCVCLWSASVRWCERRMRNQHRLCSAYLKAYIISHQSASVQPPWIPSSPTSWSDYCIRCPM